MIGAGTNECDGLDNQLPAAGVETGTGVEFHEGVGNALVVGVAVAGVPKGDDQKLLPPPNGLPKGLLSTGAGVLLNGEADAKGLGLLWNGFVKPLAMMLSPKLPVQLEAPSGLLSTIPPAPLPPRTLALCALTRRLHVQKYSLV